MIHSSVWITKLFHFRCAKLFLFFVVEKYLTVATLTDNCRHSVARPRLTQTRNTLVVMIVTRLLPATSRPRRYKTQICNIRHPPAGSRWLLLLLLNKVSHRLWKDRFELSRDDVSLSFNNNIHTVTHFSAIFRKKNSFVDLIHNVIVCVDSCCWVELKKC